jgi:multiple sugar transport system permease protein
MALSIIMIVPFLFSLFIMLNDVNLLENAGRFSFTGFKNINSFFTDERARNSVWITLKFIIGALLAEILLGVTISMFLDRKFRLKKIIRSLIIIPMFMTPVVSGLIWRTFFDPNAGIISYIAQLLTGSQLDMLGNRFLALPAVIIVDAWQWTPFFILLCMASLDTMPEDALEAAKVEGANEWQIIFMVKIPMILPAIITASVLRTIDALKAFDVIYVMTKGGPGRATETLNMYIYTIAFNFYRIGYATAAAFIFTLTVTLILSQVIRRSKII